MPGSKRYHISGFTVTRGRGQPGIFTPGNISSGKVNVTDVAAELLAMETISARPIEDKVAISLVAIPRKGVKAIQIGDRNIFF